MKNLLNMIQVKSSVDGPALTQLGYRLDIKKGGYVSPSGATIVYLYRKPYFGEVVRVKSTDKPTYFTHSEEVKCLRYKGIIE